MQDYLTKPFTADQLMNKIAKHAPVAAEDKSHEPVTEEKVIVDFEKLLALFDDRSFVLEMLEEFASTFPQYESGLQECCDQHDATRAYQLAHKLKGAAATLSADRIHQIAVQMESSAEDGQLQQIQEQLQEIEQEFEGFQCSVREQSLAAAKS